MALRSSRVLRGGSVIAAIVATLATLQVAAAPLNAHHFRFDPEHMTSSFVVLLAERSFTARMHQVLLRREDGGVHLEMLFDVSLALSASSVSPLCREVGGEFSDANRIVTGGGSDHERRISMEATGTICLDPNARLIRGEGRVEYLEYSILESRGGTDSTVTMRHLLSGPGAFLLEAVLDDSGFTGTLRRFELDGRFSVEPPGR